MKDRTQRPLVRVWPRKLLRFGGHAGIAWLVAAALSQTAAMQMKAPGDGVDRESHGSAGRRLPSSRSTRPSGRDGAMGFHHQNAALLDDHLELERPEILVYERLPDGTYRLNGVEYIVPFTARAMDAEPPTIMGQKLKPAKSLGIWYLHVWVWLENASGLFADWNPRVKCGAAAASS